MQLKTTIRHFISKRENKQQEQTEPLTKQSSPQTEQKSTTFKRKTLPPTLRPQLLMPLHGRNKFLTLIVVNPQFPRNFQIRLSPPPFNIRIHHTPKLRPHSTRRPPHTRKM